MTGVLVPNGAPVRRPGVLVKLLVTAPTEAVSTHSDVFRLKRRMSFALPLLLAVLPVSPSSRRAIPILASLFSLVNFSNSFYFRYGTHFGDAAELSLRYSS